MRTAQRRLRRFLEQRSITQSSFAGSAGVSPGMISLLIKGKKQPGLGLAYAIEELTCDWSEGPIRAEDWIKKPRAKKAA